MKKLLLSVAALMVATLLFSQSDSVDVKESISQEDKTEVSKDVHIAS